MNIIVRNVLAVIAAWVAGSIANISLIMLGSLLVPFPAGVNVYDPESIKASAHLFEAKHFAFPFIGHAVGTLVGGLVVSLIGGSKRFVLALIIGVLFLLGGIYASLTIPGPAWFVALDLLVAYIPMALIGWKLSGRS